MMRKLSLAAIALLLLMLSACAGHGLTIENPDGIAISEYPRRAAAGEKVTVRTEIVPDTDAAAYLNGEYIGRQTAVKDAGGDPCWEFTFTMPDGDAVLRIELLSQSVC